MKATSTITAILLVSLFAFFSILSAQDTLSPLGISLSKKDLFTRMASFLERGDLAGAKTFTGENRQALDQELDEILEDVDRGFDLLGRQKAREDILQTRFRRLEVDLQKSEKVFRFYSEITGEENRLDRLQAKRLRIKGAEHTNRADSWWDDLKYDQALEEYTKAIQVLTEAIELARSVEDQKLVESCLNNIGYAAIYSGDHIEGLRKMSEALEGAEGRGGAIHQGQYLLNLGTFYLYVAQPKESVKYSLKAVEVIREIGRRTWEANALLNLGSAYSVLGQNEQAYSYLQKALQKSEEAGDRRSHGRILFNLALTRARFGQWESAADVMEQALKWYQGNEEVYARAERTAAHYHGLSFLRNAYRQLSNEEKMDHYMHRINQLVAQDPKRLAAYLADPHLNFYKWREFRDQKKRE
ncbi:tetratricopeptide repeat protein [Acidobacteria bacterium AH-259-D05]|nr:tetratricopeptide repeat protein [Acidobacteria bacterium AH-259-D05]